MRLFIFLILLTSFSIFNEAGEFDLLHADIHIQPSFEKAEFTGEVTHTFTTKTPNSALILGARGLRIHDISVNEKLKLKYQLSTNTLTIKPPAKGWPDTFNLSINYWGSPQMQALDYGQHKTGVHFIDVANSRHPVQIWTQGETDFTSGWVPVPLSPSERCTQTTHITVPNGNLAFANGVPSDTVYHSNSTTTYSWDLQQPHAPYLFAFLTGEGLTVTQQTVNEHEYWVISDTSCHSEALAFFSNTEKMMDFIEEKLGVSYPWSNIYKQGMVRGFSSGAMENTTMVLFNNAFIHDYPNSFMDRDFSDYVVFHELFHHWFGDLVTCDSWGQLAMNEGFATYGEYLWLEYTLGKDEADAYKNEVFFQSYYLEDVKKDSFPIIRDKVENPENLFNSLRYDKPAMVLHLLRYELGDDTFWKVLKQYLEIYAFKPVTLGNFIDVVNDVTRDNYNWFFEQWFHRGGHPVLEVGITSNTVTVRQTQKGNPYNIPLVFEARYENGRSIRHNARMNEFETKITFPSAFASAEYIVFDPDATLLAETFEKKSASYWQAQLSSAEDYQSAMDAIKWADDTLTYWHQSTERKYILETLAQNLTNHKNWSIRLAAGKALIANYLPHNVPDAVMAAVEFDKKAAVRFGLMAELEKKMLGKEAKRSLSEVLFKVIASDSNQDARVVAAALKLLGTISGKPDEHRLVIEAKRLLNGKTNSEILKWRCAEILIHSRQFEEALPVICDLPDNRGFTEHIKVIAEVYELPGIPHFAKKIIEDFLVEKARFGHHQNIVKSALQNLCALSVKYPKLLPKIESLSEIPTLHSYKDSISSWLAVTGLNDDIPVRVTLPKSIAEYPQGLAFVFYTDSEKSFEDLGNLSWYDRGKIPPLEIIPTRFAKNEAFVRVSPRSVIGLSTDSSQLEIRSLSPKKLKEGRYYMMVVSLDRMTSVGLDLGKPGNLYSGLVRVTTDSINKIVLDKRIPVPDMTKVDNITFDTISSKVISNFVGQKFLHPIAVVVPQNYSSSKQYDILYDFGGYGEDIYRALVFDTNDSLRNFYNENADNLIVVHLSPNATYGDSYWVNSAVNGPFMNSLFEELIPAIEKKYCPNGVDYRYVRGGSTGGWVSLNIFLKNSNMIKGVVSYAPDPLYFGAFQLLNLYKDNAFRSGSGLTPSARKYLAEKKIDSIKYTILEEYTHELFLGGGELLYSGMQWSGWFNANGPARYGKVLPLWDSSGKIDPSVLKFWEKNNLTKYTLNHWNTLVPRFQKADITIFVGDKDTYYLDGGVKYYQDTLKKVHGLNPNFINWGKGEDHGYLRGNKLNYFKTTLERLKRD